MHYNLNIRAITKLFTKRWIPFLLLFFAFCYYGSYYRCSLYPAGEGGVEGVTALRLLEGKIPFVEAILNYNLFWFYPIVGLFQIFGPSYTVLRIFFFLLASITGLLSFYVLLLTTKRLGVATLAGFLALILPGQLFRNYMAFLVMLNMALFLKAFLLCSNRLLSKLADASKVQGVSGAQQPSVYDILEGASTGATQQFAAAVEFRKKSNHRNQLLWIGAAGLSLSLTFLIRIDLGFFLSFLFFGLSLLFPWISLGSISVTRRLFLSIAAFLLGVLGFLALHVPVYSYALHRGFAAHFAAQYQQWPHMITTEAAKLLEPFFSSSRLSPSPPPTKRLEQTLSQKKSSIAFSSNHQKATLLRSSLSSPDIREKITALNLYFPVITAFSLVLIAAGFLIKKKSRNRAIILLTSLGCSLTLFPQYFFWRPDMVHLSEFMVPMTVTILMAIVFALEAYSSSKIFFKILFSLFLTLGITTLVLYFINGCQSQSTGGIAISEGRTKEFFGENGVHVKLKPNEWDETSAIYQTILQHSKPGEYVVCFPYNPEINFMTNRPSYRYDLYCDDVTAPSTFDQVAIHEIETFHPAVIVITNWPINGTEHSRFRNWATITYHYIQSHYALDYSQRNYSSFCSSVNFNLEPIFKIARNDELTVCSNRTHPDARGG